MMPINKYMVRRPVVPALGSPPEKLTRRMFTRIITNVARSLQEHELSVAQLALMYLLDEREAMRVGDAATELGLSAPTTSRLVDDLVKQELVARSEDPNDRRKGAGVHRQDERGAHVDHLIGGRRRTRVDARVAHVTHVVPQEKLRSPSWISSSSIVPS